MILFSRKKKLQRDRDAGLVFCWRGGQGGNRGGLIIAILTASGIFAMAFWGLSLSFTQSNPESRKFAKILLLDDLSTEMALWVDQNSPFPSRWDPVKDQNHQERVQLALENVYQQVSEPTSPWKEMPEVSDPVFTPRLVERGVVELGKLPEVPDLQKKGGVFELTVVMASTGPLKKRLPKEVIGLKTEIPMQEYGSSLRFVVVLQPDGSVLYCTPVEWEGSEHAMNVENWLRLQHFKPSEKKQLETGEIIVRVEVKNHVRN